MPIVFPPTTPPLPSQLTRELGRLRRGTEKFIAHDPRLIVLWRPTRIPNGSGGWLPAAPLGIYEQQMRLIPQGSSTATEQAKPDGRNLRSDWVLMARYNAEMRRGDRFFMPDGSLAQVAYVQEHRAYQTKGEVLLVGRES